jgi:hypothetical protein
MDLIWIALLALVLLPVAAYALLSWSRNRDVVGELEVLNPEATGATALVVYHPGKSDFQHRVFGGFARGLVANGWRVVVTSPSPQAPTDLSGYDLLVLGGPTYGFQPNRSIQRYLRRLGDLGGKPTVTLITALGAGERSSSTMQDLVREANGTLVGALLLYKARPNDEENPVDAQQNQALAVEMATRAAQEVALP